ncbi:MAG: PHP domain-containing protein, partial [Oscillospiraceae bacterium]|nr:PHP domain-containing protein [Oscillospiraceae bacterium]
MTLRYDFHLHSCLSPCGDNDMTPCNIVNMAKLLELDIIALTDHNTTGNCRAAMAAGAKIGLVVVPGMELCTAEEIHAVCLFPDIDSAERFDAMVRPGIPPIKNKPDI